MDPDRVRAYLQVACAGLGFDIGEIWWTTNEDSGSSSALAKIGKMSEGRSSPRFSFLLLEEQQNCRRKKGCRAFFSRFDWFVYV
jgi:hypothetical protein